MVDAAPLSTDPLHAEYLADPSPANLRKVVDKLKPTIHYALSSVQAHDDPYMKSRAATLAGKAVQSYSPESGASMATWVTQQLRQLHRIRRQNQGPIKLPDRIMLDNMSLLRATQDFADKHGREPDLEELADAASMPIKRIETVRRTARAMPSDSAVGDAQVTIPLMEQTEPLLDEATGYVHKESDGLDRQILEMKTGYGGKYSPMEPKDIALQLRIPPYELSRRSARLALKLHQTHELLKEVAG